MALRGRTMTKELDRVEEPAEEQFSQRRKPEIGQFRLQVDRQSKASFATYKEAEEAGMKIKRAHPVVQVSVYDTVAWTNQIIEVPQAPSSKPLPS